MGNIGTCEEKWGSVERERSTFLPMTPLEQDFNTKKNAYKHKKHIFFFAK